MSVSRFVWTAHAELRLLERGLDRDEVEHAISSGHDAREVNDGRAQWVVRCTTATGESFEVIYDHPHGDDVTAARVVSAWRLG